jgi:hypothetical protein
MGPWLMGSFGQWNQTDTDLPVFCTSWKSPVHLLIVIIRLMLSVLVWPKVIPKSSIYSTVDVI